MRSQFPPQLLRSAPYLPVANVEKSVRYFARVLGFHVDCIAGNPPEFAIVSRDGLAIMLRRPSRPGFLSPNEAQGGTWDVFFWILDAEALHVELRAKGADVVYAPVVQAAYGMLEFAVRDHDGYVLGFGQEVTVATKDQS